MSNILLTLGALAYDPSVQIEAQGAVLLRAEVHDRDAQALARLSVRGLLTEAEAERARKRLMSSISKDVRASPPDQASRLPPEAEKQDEQ